MRSFTDACRESNSATTEAVAEGERKALQEFQDFLHRGPPSAVVQQVDVRWESPTGEFGRFGVRYR